MRLRVSKLDFPKLVQSHGWAFLCPFSWCPRQETLTRPLLLSEQRKVTVAVRSKQTPKHTILIVSTSNGQPLSDNHKIRIKKQISRMFRLNEDFSEFQDLCANDPILRFVSKHKCGGMLRSPTCFEDLIKTVCTTNCGWRNTKQMCSHLCRLGGGVFPSPATVLKCSSKRLSQEVPLGYRARTVYEISRRTFEGKLPLDKWSRNKKYEQIRFTLKDIWGIGDYSINHMLVLLGDYSEIPVDSEVLAYLRNIHFDGREVSAKEATMPYERYGEYKFLAFKFGRMARKLNYVNK